MSLKRLLSLHLSSLPPPCGRLFTVAPLEADLDLSPSLFPLALFPPTQLLGWRHPRGNGTPSRTGWRSHSSLIDLSQTRERAKERNAEELVSRRDLGFLRPRHYLSLAPSFPSTSFIAGISMARLDFTPLSSFPAARPRRRSSEDFERKACDEPLLKLKDSERDLLFDEPCRPLPYVALVVPKQKLREGIEDEVIICTKIRSAELLVDAFSAAPSPSFPF